jgi:hypothetical protein
MTRRRRRTVVRARSRRDDGAAIVSRRGVIAIALIVAWLGGLGMLARRELFKGSGQRLAELALRITPETFYYVVEQDGRQVGFASSAIDTAPRAIIVKDAFAAELVVAGQAHSTSAQSEVRLSRGMVVQAFKADFSADSAPIAIDGNTEGDTAIRFTIRSGESPPETHRLAVKGPVLLPTLVPLAIALGEPPKVGKRFTLPTFDPGTMATRDLTIEIRAESLFTIADSAGFDSTTARWVVVHRDTVRAWKLGSDDGRYPASWVDERGRIVESVQAGGFVLRRTAFEVAFENWRNERRTAGTAPRAGHDDVLEATAIAAGVRLTAALPRLRVRLRAAALDGFDLDGGRQTLAGNLLEVRRETDSSIAAGAAALPSSAVLSFRYKAQLGAEPLLQVGDARLQALVGRLSVGTSDKRVIAERLLRWVYDSLRKQVTISVPDALRVLAQRSGDCNEHTQLYVALARTAHIPARMASGLAYVNGRFYFHAWPEVFLGSWVAVDPTFGQFPADAAHLRFVVGGLTRQAALLSLIGSLRIDVLEPAPAQRSPQQTP